MKMPRKTKIIVTESEPQADYKENLQNNIIDDDRVKPRQTRKRQSPTKKSVDESPPKFRRPNTKQDSPGLSDKLKHKLYVSEDGSKYRSARRALTRNENFHLPGREKEIEQLKDFIDNLIENEASGSLYISGQPGTGKTASLMKIMSNEEYRKRVKMVYINCTSVSSVGSIYKRIVSELSLKTQGTTEKDSLQAIEKYLDSKHKMLMIVLDEIDQLTTKKQTVLYKIFEWPSYNDSKLILVGIANALDLTDRNLSRLQAKCELKPELMHFAPYSKAQIVEIFKSRLEESGVLDLFPPATLQLLAAKVASVSGDIRRALDIGRRVVEIAEQSHKKLDIKQIEHEIHAKTEENPKNEVAPVQIKEVLSVLNNVYGTSQVLVNEEDDAFPLQQKMLVCALLLIIKHDKNKDITIGRLHDVYKKVCTKRNLMALDQAEFMSLCSLVEVRGIIRIQKKKESRLSRITLQWDGEEVNSALKDKQLIAAILADKSCLAR